MCELPSTFLRRFSSDTLITFYGLTATSHSRFNNFQVTTSLGLKMPEERDVSYSLLIVGLLNNKI
jgi:hypothetical protein